MFQFLIGKYVIVFSLPYFKLVDDFVIIGLVIIYCYVLAFFKCFFNWWPQNMIFVEIFTSLPQWSVISATPILLHINVLLLKIYLFEQADALVEVPDTRTNSEDIRCKEEAIVVTRLNLNLKAAFAWGDVKTIRFNASKTQAGFLFIQFSPTFRDESLPSPFWVTRFRLTTFGRYIQCLAKTAAKNKTF